MSLWIYTGKDSSEKPVKGRIMADDPASAKDKLSRMGIQWISVDPADRQPDSPRAPNEPPLRPLGSLAGICAAKTRTQEEDVQKTVRSFQESSKVGAQPPTRKLRQRVLYGPGLQVQSEANAELLRGGKVLHALMSPDASGRPHVLLVIEEGEQ